MRIISLARLAFIITGFYLNFTAASASPLVYTPVNPNFGGNPFNGSTLLSEANANNHYVARKDTSSTTGIENLVTISVFSSISANITNQILHSIDGQSGSFTTGTAIISFRNVGGNISLTVYDNITGSTQTFDGIKAGI